MATQKKFRIFGLLAWEMWGRRLRRESAVRAFALSKRFTPLRAVLGILLVILSLVPPLAR